VFVKPIEPSAVTVLRIAGSKPWNSKVLVRGVSWAISSSRWNEQICRIKIDAIGAYCFVV
jgi:hypothetical protein